MALPTAAVALKNWKLLVGGGILLVLGLYIYTLKQDAKQWMDLYDEAKTELVTVKNNELTLKAAIETQNSQIQQMERDLANMDIVLAERDKQRELLKKQYEKRLKDLINEETPVTCQTTIDYLVDGVEDLR